MSTPTKQTEQIRPTRIYISNINYYTDEQEMEQLLADYNAVFLPNYTVKLGRNRNKPLGIAYAEFKELLDANRAIEALNGHVFKNRTLKVRLHVPYCPRFKYSETEKPVEEKADGDSIGSVKSGEIVTKGSATLPISKYSENVIYLNQVHHKNTEESILELFAMFGPCKLYRAHEYQRRTHGSILRHRFVSYFVELELNETPLDDVVKSLRDVKLNGRAIFPKKAYLGKFESCLKKWQAEKEEQEKKTEEEEKEQEPSKGIKEPKDEVLPEIITEA